MNPFAKLNDEHRWIERLLTALTTYAARLDSGADPTDLGRFVDLFAGFADARHHRKEEDILFEAMVEQGFPRNAGPLAVMLYEHAQGRRLVAAMGEIAARAGAWTGEDRVRIADAADAFSQLLRQHISKEDMVLYPMAQRILTEDTIAAIDARFDEIDGSPEARDEMQRFLATADMLFARYLGAPDLGSKTVSARVLEAALR